MATPTSHDPPRSTDADATPRPHGEARGILANVTYSLVAQLVSGVFTAVLTLYLVRALGATGYGDFSLAIGVGAMVGVLADFGVSASAARFVAEQRADRGGLAEILADAFRLKLLASTLACGALVALAGPIAAAYHAPIAWPIRLIAFVVLGQGVMLLFMGAFVAAGRTATNVRVAFGESVVEFSTSLALVLLGGGVVGATTGRAIGYGFGAGVGIALGARAFGWPQALRRRGRPSNVRRIARYAAPIMLVSSGNVLFTTVDVLLIGAFLGSEHVGLFSAPLRLLVLFWYPATAVSQGVAPRMVRGSDRTPDVRELVGGLRSLILYLSWLLVPLLIWTKPIVDILLGSGYGGSITTMRVLALSVYLGGLAPLVAISANFLGDAALRVPLMFGAALLDGAIDVVLIPRIGIVSGAIATAVAYAVMLVGHLAICSRHLDIPYGEIGTTALRALGAAAAMEVVLTFFGTDPGIPMLLVGGLAGTVAFVVALVLLQEVSRSELATIWLRTRARLPLVKPSA